MGFKFLIDENLSPDLAALAHERGHEATSVRDMSWAGRRDDELVRFAFERDYVLVTRNFVDFRRLLIDVELHPGLVFLHAEHGFDANLQSQLFALALVHAEELGLLVNKVIEVEAEDDRFRIDHYDLPL